MSDDMNMSGEDQFAPVGEVTPLPAPPIIKAETVSRNALLFVAGAILLAVTIGFVWYAMSLGNTAPPSSPPIVVVPNGGPGTTPSTPGTGTVDAPSISPVDDRDVFTPRNPFEVISPITIAVASTDTNDSNDTTDTDDNDDNDVLTLSNIVTDDGVRKAVVRLNGTTYTVAAGETVGSSSWSIVEVNSDNIVAMFGDEQVTISLGDK